MNNNNQIITYATSITPQITTNPTRMISIPMCPDLLQYDYLGEADNLRGRVVRAFFWLMRVWPV